LKEVIDDREVVVFEHVYRFCWSIRSGSITTNLFQTFTLSKEKKNRKNPRSKKETSFDSNITFGKSERGKEKKIHTTIHKSLWLSVLVAEPGVGQRGLSPL
jgi:hypothetical protein